MKIAYFDCPAGISGDMSLAALIDAGAEIDKIKNLLSLLPISGWRLGAQEVQKQGLRALKVSVAFTREHAHRGLNEIRKILTVACLPAKVEENALAVFGRLAEAEARVHGCGAEEVHFHETGAVDAIIDIVGVCAALHLLGVEKVFCAPPPLGRGFVQCAHGLLPLPAPAVVELLRGYPSVGLDIEGETVTPTGAALVTALSEPQNFGPYPPCTVESVGYGAGSRDFPFPNLLRVIIGEQSEQAQTVEVIRASIDDMNPEQLGYLWEKAFAAGALDMTYTPLIMKKGRPGVGLTLTAQCGQAADLARLIFAETTTSGLRVSREERIVLPRKKETVSTAYGEIEIKISGEGPGRTVAPEFESCRAAAQKSGAPLKAVYQAALAAAANKGGAI